MALLGSVHAADRYKFRTSPLRNVALQPAFFHNGAFTRLKDAIRYHLDAPTFARSYNPAAADVAQRPEVSPRSDRASCLRGLTLVSWIHPICPWKSSKT